MSNKFNRSYVMTITIPGDPLVVTIQPPLTLDFDITRNDLASANTATFRIYNLSPLNRSKLRINQWDFGKFFGVTLRAGYLGISGSAQNLPVVFTGSIRHAWSTRQGVDFVTQFECFDGGFAFVNSNTNKTIISGTPQVDILKSLVGDLGQYNVTPGAIGNFPGSNTRGTVYSDKTLEVLKQVSNDQFFVDNGKANVLRKAPYTNADGSSGNAETILTTTIPLVNAASGLLNTPLRTQTGIEFEMIFEPSLFVAMQVNLQSNAGDPYNNFNGIKKVISFHHRGTISPSICGEALTTVGLLDGVFTQIPAATS